MQAVVCVILSYVPAALVVATFSYSVVAEESRARYPFDYPAGEQFCPPVYGFFDEVQRTIDRGRSRAFRHQPNGGYGLPVADKVGAQHLLHLGADVGWYRVGDPVFAVANGVVRLSQGENEKADTVVDAANGKATPARASSKGKGSKMLAWGNVVVIEHRMPDGKYVTTIYGHLANERIVKTGDVVRAGQQIGVIGATKVNGGYKPHSHLGVREGRLAEVGRKVVLLTSIG